MKAVKQQLPKVQKKQPMLKTPLPVQRHLLILMILEPHHNLQVLSQLPPLAAALIAHLPARYNQFPGIHAYVLIFILEILLNM
jgi:hypothetical protein